MPRIDEMPDYRAKLGSTSHDLSHSFGFTATCAHLLPVYHDLVQPGERVRLGFNFNLRTQPLQSAAMEEIDVYTEYFFVPMPLLYEPFGNTYYNIADNFSSNFALNAQGLGNDFPVFPFDSFASEIYTSRAYKPYSQDGVTVGESLGQMYYRLMDMLGYNPTISEDPSAMFNPNVFPFPLLAYHCIYQYYYRLDSREKFNQHSFNWDKYYNTSVVPDDALSFVIHYRPISNDYFSDIKVSPIVDVLNLNVKSSFEQANQWLTRRTLPVVGDEVLSSGSTIGSVGSLSPLNDIRTNFGFTGTENPDGVAQANGQDINTANIRAMFATEKLWSVTGRAKKHYDDQTLAHFGFKVPHDPKHEISVFGKDHSVIHIGEVISTAATSDAPLGEIAGKGYGQQQAQRHDFTAPCHGVVMVIFSIVPRRRYENTYLKVNALTSRLDLPIPEYDHLGMQPLFRYETNINGTNAQERSDVMGWQYRYEQYKRRYNRVTRVFQSEGTLSSWMLHNQANALQLPNGANQNQYLSFVYWPTAINSIMLVPYVNNWSETFDQNNALVYDADPFIIDSFIYSKKISWMSDYSLPRLDA